MSLTASTASITSCGATTAPDEPGAAESADRIGSLDVLRGVALLGMFLVQFNDHAIGGDTAAGLSATYRKVVALFFEERFWTCSDPVGVASPCSFDGRRLEARRS